MAKKRVWHPYWDTHLLLTVTAVLVVFGVAAVYGASSIVAIQSGEAGHAFALRQTLGVLLGVGVMWFAARWDYHYWEGYARPLVIVVAVLLVILLLPFADALVLRKNGSSRWFTVFGLIAFQPSEVAKFAIVIWTAKWAAEMGQDIRQFREIASPLFLVIAPVALLILLEPDLSTAFVLSVVAGIVLFTGGAKVGHVLVGAVAAALLAWPRIASTQHQVRRLLTFLSPGSEGDVGWQIQQSLTGMGAGRLLGTGFGEGTQKMGFLPYAYSDFVFSTIGEEWGFVGVVTLIAMFGLFIWLGMRISRTAPDDYGRYLATGLTAMIGITAVLHMAVTLDLLPTTGLPLPFISYGRSNLIMSLLAAGVLINIGAQRVRSKSVTTD